MTVLHEPRFVDKSPAQVYATLLDEGIYLCSIRTMYRILTTQNEVRERRKIACRSQYKKPELLATGPNQVWSWDITKLRGPQKWSSFYLYVIIDIFSRHVVGWTVQYRETAQVAIELIAETCERQGIERDELIIHSDRGSAMTSKSLALLFADLGVTKSLSRPQVSDDNPFSERQFRTLKDFPSFPERFGCIEDAREFVRFFMNWYNNEHRHSGIALMTPATVHYGFAPQCLTVRNIVLSRAFMAHPERFVKGQPSPLPLPEQVWINPPPKAEQLPGEVATVSGITQTASD